MTDKQVKNCCGFCHVMLTCIYLLNAMQTHTRNFKIRTATILIMCNCCKELELFELLSMQEKERNAARHWERSCATHRHRALKEAESIMCIALRPPLGDFSPAARLSGPWPSLYSAPVFPPCRHFPVDVCLFAFAVTLFRTCVSSMPPLSSGRVFVRRHFTQDLCFLHAATSQ